MTATKSRGRGGDPRRSQETPASGNRSGTVNGTEPVAAGQGDESDDPFGGTVEPIRRRPKIVARYTYTDEDGEPLYQVRRDENKGFTQYRRVGSAWKPGIQGVRRVPYNLPAVLAADVVDIAEGEKDADTLTAAGRVATTNSGGARNWRPEFAEYFRGKHVRIHIDWDSPAKELKGQRHALDVYDSLVHVAASVELFRSAKGCKDVTDHVKAGHALDDLVPITADKLRWHVAVADTQADQRPAHTRQTPEDAPQVPQGLITVLGALVLAGYGPDPGTMPDDLTRDINVRCPVHDDRNPSATLRVGTDRPVVFRCHKGCTQEQFFDWCREHGVPSSELLDWKRPDSATAGRIWTPTELAERQLSPPQWIVRGVLIEDTFGTMAGEKKSLKSYLTTTLAVSVASGSPFLGEFDVVRPGAVVVFVGEGGEGPYLRRVRRICDAMGVPWTAAPHVVFDSMQFGTERFRATLGEALDRYQPTYVVIDPLYVYHDPNVAPANLYERGRMLAEVSSQVICGGASLTIVDHFNKTGSGSGLDRVSMSGVAEWSDTWMLATHRKGEPPDVEAGDFHLRLDIGSRQWGRRSLNVEYSIGRFDDELLTHDGEIQWSVSLPGHTEPAEGSQVTQRQKARELLRDAIRAVPGASKRQVVERAVSKGVGRTVLEDVLAEMIGSGEVEVVEEGRRHAVWMKGERP